MQLMELYNQMQNPLANPKTIDKLISFYAKSDDSRDFYNNLITRNKRGDSASPPMEDWDAFVKITFNKWKNSLVAKFEKVIEEYSKGDIDKEKYDDLIETYNIMRKIPDVKTRKEAYDICSAEYNNRNVKEFFKLYEKKCLDVNAYEFRHASSAFSLIKTQPDVDVEHRLYLNVDIKDVYKLAVYLIEKFEKYDLPYQFKFSSYLQRNDSLVIYSSTEYLTKYIEILKEIKNEHQNLESSIFEPIIFSGTIDNWIGYGSEPEEKDSFNNKRSKIVYSVIDETMKKWLIDHKESPITFRGKNLTFKHILVMRSLDILINRLAEPCEYLSSKYLGYTIEDIKSIEFKTKAYRVIYSNLDELLESAYNDNSDEIEKDIIELENGKKICFEGTDLEKVIKFLAPNISRTNPTINKSIVEKITAVSDQYGIDPQKFCFDTSRVEKMKLVDIQMSDIANDSLHGTNKKR